MLKCGVADAVAAGADEIAIPVSPVLYPGLALDQFVNQLVALVRIGAINESFETFRSRNAPRQVEVDAAAEFVIVSERPGRDVGCRHRAEEALVDQVANDNLTVARSDARQFRRDIARQIADLFVGARRIELFVSVLAGKRPGLLLRLRRIGAEPDCGRNPENEKRGFGESPVPHNTPRKTLGTRRFQRAVSARDLFLFNKPLAETARWKRRVPRGDFHWHLPPGHLAAINILSAESYSASETFLRRSVEPCDGGCPMSVLCAMTMSSLGNTVMYWPPAPMPVYAPSNGPGEFGASQTHHI